MGRADGTTTTTTAPAGPGSCRAMGPSLTVAPATRRSHPVDVPGTRRTGPFPSTRSPWETLLAAGSPFRAREGHSLIARGQPCPGVTVLLRGHLRIYLQDLTGRELVLYRLGPRDICSLSLVSVLRDQPFPANVVAESDVEGAQIPRTRFLELLDRDRGLRHHVLAYTAERLAEALALVECSVFGDLQDRILHALVRRLDGQGEAAVLSVTHEELARETGSTRESISRTLKLMERRGCLRLGRGRIEILERGMLQRGASRNGPRNPGGGNQTKG